MEQSSGDDSSYRLNGDSFIISDSEDDVVENSAAKENSVLKTRAFVIDESYDEDFLGNSTPQK